MTCKVLWISEEKKSKKDKSYYSVLVGTDDFRGWGIFFRPVSVGEEVNGLFDFTKDKPCFFETK